MPRRATYKDKMNAWLSAQAGKLRSPNTIRTYRNALNWSTRRAEEWDLPADVKKWDGMVMQRFYAEALRTLAPKSQQTFLTALYKCLRESGCEAANAVELRIGAKRRKADWLCPEQVTKLIGSARSVHVRGLIVLLAYTGLRASEAAELTMSQIEERKIVLTGKGRKDRIVPLTKEFWREFNAYWQWRKSVKTSSSRVMIHIFRGTIWEYTGEHIKSALLDFSKSLGFHCSPHTLRRTFGRELWKAGCPIPTISKILGHSDIKTTIEYLGIDESDMTNALDQFVPKMYLGG